MVVVVVVVVVVVAVVARATYIIICRRASRPRARRCLLRLWPPRMEPFVLAGLT